MDRSLTAIFEKVKTGDKAAFDALFLKSYPPLYTFALRFIDNEAEAENIVQDVMLHLWENRMNAKIRNVNSYLFTAVRNRCLTALSHREIKERVHDSIRISAEMSMSGIQDIDIMNELAQRLEEALAALPDEYREAFEMNRFQNRSYKEIADIMHVSPKTIAWRMSRVLGELRIRLRDFL